MTGGSRKQQVREERLTVDCKNDDGTSPRRHAAARRWAGAACAIAAMAVAVAGCGSGDDKPASSTTASALAGKRVEVIGPVSGDPYYEEVACGAKSAGEKLGLEVGSQQAVKLNQAQQDSIVQNVLLKHPAGIVYTPADGVAGGIPLRTVNQDDVIVIDVDAELADSSLYTSFIASNHYAGGQLITKKLAEMIGGAGEIAALSAVPSHPITRARIEGFKAALKAYPKIRVVSVTYTDLTPSAMQSAASSLLTKYPHLKGFYTTNYFNASGAAVALRNAGLAGKVKMVSWDAGSVNVKLLQEGVEQAAVAQQPFKMGELAIQQIAKKLQGKPVEKTLSSPVSILTSEDVNTSEGKELWYKGGDCS